VYGYAGEILRVNLSDRSIRKESSEKYVRDWLGGPGFAIKILYDELRSWVTPYAPANKIIFSSGPLIGTVAPGACKMNISTLGPVTGGWATGSSDSHVGGQLKLAGYDAVIVEGRAHTPVYLYITDDEVEIRPADHLWGMTTWETLRAIREELQDPTRHIISIGPAGENLVRGACIIQDTNRAFGRCGSGSVMGSKNLKAIVARGTKPVRIADPDRFAAIVKKSRKMILGGKNVERFRKYGTLSIFARKQEVCGMNYKNFQHATFPEDVAAKVDPVKTIDNYMVARRSFPGCPVGCGRQLHFTDGPSAGTKVECNQFEAVITLQGRLAVEEPTFMYRANARCNELGIDIDAAGGAIGWAMECYERGILSKEDTDGLDLKWGNEEAVFELIRKISYREGFGNVLAEGSFRAADIIGRDSAGYAIHLKKQDLYEPLRGANGWCLGAVTSTRGGGHTTGAPWVETTGTVDPVKAREIFGAEKTDDPISYDGKAQMVLHSEILQRASNCLGMCIMNTTVIDLDYPDLKEIAELYSAATGVELAVDDLRTIAMRQLNLEKAFNLRFTDFDRKDDYPEPRQYNEPISGGALQGWKFDKAEFNRMLDEYYDLHGWERETSFPTRRVLCALGLDAVAGDLERIGKLGKEDPQST
jgi:aldehyde:ferredoxin oxidoreductase